MTVAVPAVVQKGQRFRMPQRTIAGLRVAVETVCVLLENASLVQARRMRVAVTGVNRGRAITRLLQRKHTLRRHHASHMAG